jgi:hypothetical protein
MAEYVLTTLTVLIHIIAIIRFAGLTFPMDMNAPDLEITPASAVTAHWMIFQKTQIQNCIHTVFHQPLTTAHGKDPNALPIIKSALTRIHTKSAHPIHGVTLLPVRIMTTHSVKHQDGTVILDTKREKQHAAIMAAVTSPAKQIRPAMHVKHLWKKSLYLLHICQYLFIRISISIHQPKHAIHPARRYILIHMVTCSINPTTTGVHSRIPEHTNTVPTTMITTATSITGCVSIKNHQEKPVTITMSVSRIHAQKATVPKPDTNRSSVQFQKLSDRHAKDFKNRQRKSRINLT